MAFSLQPMDWNGLSDPYLKLQLGESEIDDCANYLSDTVDPEFYKCFELKAELPVPHNSVEVWDHDDFMPDDMIGKPSSISKIDSSTRVGTSLAKTTRNQRGGPAQTGRNQIALVNSVQQPTGRLQMWVELLTGRGESPFQNSKASSHLSLKNLKCKLC